MAVPLNTKLYDTVKKAADSKFFAKTSAYKSAWIVREYKKRGGAYSSPKKSRQPSGLRRWFAEAWVDMERPVRKNGKIVAYEQCGRNNASNNKKALTGRYPYCRPSRRVTRHTPATVRELSSKRLSTAKKTKQVVKHRSRVFA
jgi:hypothetical protein